MIADRQKDDRALTYMKARQQVWLKAKRLLLLQLTAVVILPAIGTGVGLWRPEFRPYAAAIALFISVLDLSLLDRIYRSLLVDAARLAEQFDTFVLGIPWNKFIAGPRPDHETVFDAASAYKEAEITRLQNWYPSSFFRLPEYQARLLCQRTNIWYDAKLRNFYAYSLLSLIVLLSGGLMWAALINPVPITDLVLSYLAPLSPVFLWAVREFFRQKDTVMGQNRIKQNVEGMWSSLASGSIDAGSAATISRQLQDAIFVRRATSPLIFPGLYSAMRSKLEEQMTYGADQLTAELESKAGGPLGVNPA